MNILQFNVQLAEDGAAGATLDLHQRVLQRGLASHFVYGYGGGGRENVSHRNYSQVIKHTSWMTVIANIALFCLLNRDLLGSFSELYRTITRTSGPVVPHLHMLHNYRLNLKNMVRLRGEVKNREPDITLVQTLRGHWSATGRCALTGGCEDWRTGCQKCPTLNNYPPTKTDHVHQLVVGKWQLFREMLALSCQFTSPSQRVADAFSSLYGPGRRRIISNGIDMATEAILADLSPMHETQGKPKIVVVMYDLRYNSRTNQQLACEMTVLSDKIELNTFGKFSPFTAGNVANHGFEIDKCKLMSVLSQVDALVFNSHVDNHPLILCEALSIGVSVIATHSDATREVLQKPGGKAVSEGDVLQLVQLGKPEIAQTIFGTALAEFSQRSRAIYSEQQMLEEYVNFYQNLQLPAAIADLPIG